MSPEQVEADPDKIGAPADVYALGVMIYQMICGKVPFEGSAASVMGKILTQPITPPSEVDAKECLWIDQSSRFLARVSLKTKYKHKRSANGWHVGRRRYGSARP